METTFYSFDASQCVDCDFKFSNATPAREIWGTRVSLGGISGGVTLIPPKWRPSRHRGPQNRFGGGGGHFGGWGKFWHSAAFNVERKSIMRVCQKNVDHFWGGPLWGG